MPLICSTPRRFNTKMYKDNGKGELSICQSRGRCHRHARRHSSAWSFPTARTSPRDQAAAANRDYAGASVQQTTKSGGGGRIQLLTGAFAPAAHILIKTYAPRRRIDQIFLASNSQTSPQRIIDRSADGFNDLLLGSDGADTLTAGPGKAYLDGGAGSDVLSASLTEGRMQAEIASVMPVSSTTIGRLQAGS
jgi:hypothetical protein